MDIEVVRKIFAKRFEGRKGNVYFAPGRINLIGEHTDYNGGFVFPGAVTCGIMAEVCPNNTDIIRAYAIDLDDSAQWAVDDAESPQVTWAKYIYGMIREFQALGVKVGGFDVAFAGDVPLGAGMSSSAALEVCFGVALNDLFAGNTITTWQIALAGQATEHKYVGVKCGIMDQFASAFGKKGQLMRLDCNSLEFEYYPFAPVGYKLVLVNTCVKHELVGSPYNDRRCSCERVARAVAAKHTERNINTLRDCTWEDLQEVQAGLSAEDLQRATFVLGEKDRVLAVCEALQRGDYEEVGKQMYLTHEGLSKAYEVSCEELDFLNQVAKTCGVTGSRMMGGGFGGCTINLVKDECYDNFVQTAIENFKARYGKAPQIIPVHIGDGGHKVC